MLRCDILFVFCLLWLGLGLAFAGAHLWTVLPPVLVYVALAADGSLRAAAPWLMPVIAHGSRANGTVALSFDDGPDAAVTPLVLDVLREHQARATFFVIGRHAEAHPELIRRMIGEGHEVANHSYTHSRMLNLRLRKAVHADIARGAHALRRLSPHVSSTLYRPPMGLKNPVLARLQKRMGLRVVAWSLHARDTSGRSDAQRIARRVLRRIRAGDIVLFHDGHDLAGKRRGMEMVHALDTILPALAQRGLQPVTVGELIADETRPASASTHP